MHKQTSKEKISDDKVLLLVLFIILGIWIFFAIKFPIISDSFRFIGMILGIPLLVLTKVKKRIADFLDHYFGYIIPTEKGKKPEKTIERDKVPYIFELYTILGGIYGVLLALVISSKAVLSFSSWTFILWCSWVLAVLVRIIQYSISLIVPSKKGRFVDNAILAVQFAKHSIFLFVPIVSIVPFLVLCETLTIEEITSKYPWGLVESGFFVVLSILALAIFFYHWVLTPKRIMKEIQDVYFYTIVGVPVYGLIAYNLSPLDECLLKLLFFEWRIPSIIWLIYSVYFYVSIVSFFFFSVAVMNWFLRSLIQKFHNYPFDRFDVLLISLGFGGVSFILLGIFLSKGYLIDISFLFLSCFTGWLIGDALAYLDNHFDIFSAKKASSKEVQREDDVLLECMGFLQAAIFVYLSLYPRNSLFVNTLKWSTPLFAVVFYIIRAYAKINDSNKHRYYSIYILCLLVLFDLMSFANQYSALFYIFGRDVTISVNVIIVSSAFGFARTILLEKAKKRYGTR